LVVVVVIVVIVVVVVAVLVVVVMVVVVVVNKVERLCELFTKLLLVQTVSPSNSPRRPLNSPPFLKANVRIAGLLQRH
jgi:hypothetical protein